MQDRILATCEANGLAYVNDPTNFQPEATLRNAVRQMLIQQDQGGKPVRCLNGQMSHTLITNSGHCLATNNYACRHS